MAKADGTPDAITDDRAPAHPPRRLWLAPHGRPSNALCEHSNCSIQDLAAACDEFRRNVAEGLDAMIRRQSAPPPGPEQLEQLVRRQWGLLPPPPASEREITQRLANVYGVVEAGGRVYVLEIPRELDGVRRDGSGLPIGPGRGISHTEALVLAAWIVSLVPAGAARLGDILAELKRL